MENRVDNREKLLEQLTGVDSSKLNYYVELKKRNEEVLRQNSRLEILHQLIRDINIDMSLEDIIERAFRKLPAALPCDFLGLATLRGGNLTLRATAPQDFCTAGSIPRESRLWHALEAKEATTYDPWEDGPFLSLLNPDYPHRLRSLAVAPLFERAAITGLLLVGSTREVAYPQPEFNFVQHLADKLAFSMQNAQLYKRVSRAKMEWEATFRAVTDAIFLVDTDYNILQHNNRLPAELADYWSEVESNKCFARLKRRDEPCLDCPIQEILANGEPVFRRVQTETGLVLDLSYYPVVNDKGKLAAVTHIIKDVTKKAKLEAQLVQSAKLAAIGEMAAGVAHELNSPMTVVIGSAQLLLRNENLKPEDGELLGDIVSCGLRCKRIIQNLLTFSRQDQLPITDTDLNAEVEGALSLIKYQIDQNRIQLVKDLDPDLPRISANGQQIQQVLANFLVNARDAMADVEREHKIIAITSAVRNEAGHRRVVVSVRDNGIGISHTDLQKIFNPFYTSKEGSRGTGLGLSVSLGIAQSHHGTIEVDSQPGRGSTFSLVLPAD